MEEMWLWRPADREPVDPNERQLGRKTLLDLAKVQAWLSHADFDVEYDFWAATDDCWNDLQTLGWTFEHAVRVVCALRENDYYKSEWCETEGGWFPCDSYRIRYDDTNNQRNKNAVRYYLKFSLDDSGQRILVLVSAHIG